MHGLDVDGFDLQSTKVCVFPHVTNLPIRKLLTTNKLGKFSSKSPVLWKNCLLLHNYSRHENETELETWNHDIPAACIAGELRVGTRGV